MVSSIRKKSPRVFVLRVGSIKPDHGEERGIIGRPMK